MLLIYNDLWLVQRFESPPSQVPGSADPVAESEVASVHRLREHPRLALTHAAVRREVVRVHPAVGRVIMIRDHACIICKETVYLRKWIILNSRSKINDRGNRVPGQVQQDPLDVGRGHPRGGKLALENVCVVSVQLGNLSRLLIDSRG